MTALKLTKLFVLTSVFFLIMDFIWLNVIAKPFYMTYMKNFLAIKDGNIQFNMLGAVLVYLVLVGGIFVFVLPNSHTLTQALLYGIAYGLVTYGTYDLTCQAVMNAWPWLVTGVDMLWGLFICSSTSVVAFLLDKYLA